MPIRSIFARAMMIALACGGPPVPSHAADRYDGELNSQWKPVFDFGTDKRAGTRDLRPKPTKPSHASRRPRATLLPSSPVVPVGAPITFEVGSSVDGFGHIYVLSASGRVQVWMENVPVAAGQPISFPTGKLRITAAPPAGQEDIVLIVTRDRIDGFLGDTSTRDPRDLTYGPHDFKEAVRDKFEDLPLRDWGYARALVQVVNGTGEEEDLWDWGSDD